MKLRRIGLAGLLALTLCSVPATSLAMELRANQWSITQTAHSGGGNPGGSNAPAGLVITCYSSVADPTNLTTTPDR